jgi:ketosteroid isomerase-like protein
VTVEDVLVSGDIAVQTPTYEVTPVPSAGGRETRDEVTYLVVRKRQPDGSWTVVRDLATPAS